jgi:hypothetical protein
MDANSRDFEMELQATKYEKESFSRSDTSLGPGRLVSEKV